MQKTRSEDTVAALPRIDRASGSEMSDYSRSTELDDELLERVLAVVRPGDEITTLSNKRPNRIVSVCQSGVEVETLRSDRRGTGPQTVPAWMIVVAWHHLRQKGELSQNELLNDLNVKRSAFVCALSAQFPRCFVSFYSADSLGAHFAMTADRRHAHDGGKLMSNRSQPMQRLLRQAQRDLVDGLLVRRRRTDLGDVD